MSAGCVFCQVVTGEHSSANVLDEPEVLAFLDIRPLFPGHVLVVPKVHYDNLMELSVECVGPLFDAVQRLSIAVRAAMDSDGIFVASNNGVSQSVDHLHVHVVPRNEKDGLRGFMWPRRRYESDTVMQDVAQRIRGAL